MRFKSPIVGAVSGSIGGTTYAHNAGGMYMRARATPTDPGRPAQMVIRGIVASLVNHWVNTLITAQRSAWEGYAENVPLPDVFGDPRYRSGINHYVRSNVGRLQRGLTRIDDGPTTFNLGQFTSPTFAVNGSLNVFVITIVNTDDWANETGSYMLVWGSRPQNPTINFFKGPYKSMVPIAGDDETPPENENSIGVPYVYVPSQKGFLRVNVSRADGRLSTPFRIGAIST